MIAVISKTWPKQVSTRFPLKPLIHLTIHSMNWPNRFRSFLRSYMIESPPGCPRSLWSKHNFFEVLSWSAAIISKTYLIESPPDCFRRLWSIWLFHYSMNRPNRLRSFLEYLPGFPWSLWSIWPFGIYSMNWPNQFWSFLWSYLIESPPGFPRSLLSRRSNWLR
jgi:hypothetical protein